MRCGASCRSTSRRSPTCPPVDIVAHRVLWSLPFLALLIALSRGWAKVRAAVAQPRTLGILARHRAADRRQLAALRLCRDQRPHPRRELRLLSQPARQRPARPLRAQGAADPAAMDRGRDRRRRHFGACRRRARPVVDQPHPVRQLRALRAAAERSCRPTRSPALAIETAFLFPLAIAWLGWRTATGAPSR